MQPAQGRQTRRWTGGLAVLAIAVVLAVAPVRTTAYVLFRAYGSAAAVAEARGLSRLDGPNVTIAYAAQDAAVADLVLNVAEELYGEVTRLVGHEPRRGPLIIIHPDRASLRSRLGWAQGPDAVGAYWTGVVRLLSPRVWAQGDMAEVFRREGPLAHELAHYVLDLYTAGNYPRWYTEGLAQWIEYELTGYLWVEGADDPAYMYPLGDLAHSFARLPDQARAYRQSFLVVAYLVDKAGAGSLRGLNRLLAAGRPFAAALRQSAGFTLRELEPQWLEWVGDNAWRFR
ncbi:MAG: hypothetical protein AB1492_09000 [Bacillota bacterium]